MENKFKIGQEVFVGGDVRNAKVIKDFEFFGDMILYYMDDCTAYPDSIVFSDARMWLYSDLCKTSIEERDLRFINLLKESISKL